MDSNDPSYLLDKSMNLVPLNSKNFELFANLFTPCGSGCYCAVWRTFDDSWKERCNDPTHPNRKIAKEFVDNGHHWGFLAFESETLSGWAAAGPKTEFPLLKSKLGSRLSQADQSVWSIGCIIVKETFGIEAAAKAIILAVIGEAKRAGAKFIEAYPTDPWDEPRSYRGKQDWYRSLGFAEFSSEMDGQSRILCLRLIL